ncbi:MAG: hypothetical protein AMS24_04940 [Chlamydiae bacterium SM23_39]|nr:MAG: hypothetical protein AMS24_04940 [Chlamydiae bacterium SM23_39]
MKKPVCKVRFYLGHFIQRCGFSHFKSFASINKITEDFDNIYGFDLLFDLAEHCFKETIINF